MPHVISPARPALHSPFSGLLRQLSHAAGVAMQRRRLARLDDAQLADIGLTRAQATAEARRPFWDLP